MNTDIQVFSNAQFGEIRTAISESGEPLFCLADLCKALNLSNTSKVKSQLEDDLTLSYPIVDNLGRMQQATFVTESGMYTVILRSDSPKATPMQKWVTKEVLPTIRKTGSYSVEKSIPQSFADALRLAADQQERIEKQSLILEAQRPKVLFADCVEASKTSILIGDLAKLLKQNGIDIGQKRLFDWLRGNGYLIKQQGTSYNMPTQKAMDLELFEIKETSITRSDGNIMISRTTKVTGKGQVYFVSKFVKDSQL